MDSTCRWGIINKLPTDTWRIMGELPSNSHQWWSTNRYIKKREPQVTRLFHVDQSTAISSQIEALTKKLMHSWSHMPNRFNRHRFNQFTLYLLNLKWLLLVVYMNLSVTLRTHAQWEHISGNNNSMARNSYHLSWQDHPNLSRDGRQHDQNFIDLFTSKIKEVTRQIGER